jgi:hypothetical protein
MEWRKALVSAFRHFSVTLAALLGALPTAPAVLGIGEIANPILVAFYGAGLAALVRFLQRIGEEALSPPPSPE